MFAAAAAAAAAKPKLHTHERNGTHDDGTHDDARLLSRRRSTSSSFLLAVLLAPFPAACAAMELEPHFSILQQDCGGFGGEGTCVEFERVRARVCYLRADKVTT